MAYQEAVSLKRQEELIREEEAAELAEIELKEKRAKKKQVNIHFLVQACHPHPVKCFSVSALFSGMFHFFCL